MRNQNLELSVQRRPLLPSINLYSIFFAEQKISILFLATPRGVCFPVPRPSWRETKPDPKSPIISPESQDSPRIPARRRETSAKKGGLSDSTSRRMRRESGQNAKTKPV